MLNEMMNQQAQQGATPPPAQPADNGGQVNDLPVDKQKMAGKIMDDASKMYENMLEPVMKSDNPAKTAGEVVGKTFHDLLEIANAQGVKIPQDVSQAVSLEMLDDILDMAEQAGKVTPESEEEREAIFKRGVSALGLKYVEEEGMSRDFEKKSQGVEQAYIQQQQGGQGQAPAAPTGGGVMQGRMGGM